MITGNHTTSALHELFNQRSSNPDFMFARRTVIAAVRTRYDAFEACLWVLREHAQNMKGKAPEEARKICVLMLEEIRIVQDLDPVVTHHF